jgi:hypothetical protein
MPHTDLTISRLETLESIIERGLTTFVEVGKALMEIRDSRLYREQHPTFENYVKARWGFTKQWAYQQIEAAEICAEVKTSLPSVEHAHMLAPLSASERHTLAPVVADLTVREAREVIQQHRGNENAVHFSSESGDLGAMTDEEIVALARRARETAERGEDNTSRFLWEVADHYKQLSRCGLTDPQIARKCHESRNIVSDFIHCAEYFPRGTERPQFRRLFLALSGRR